MLGIEHCLNQQTKQRKSAILQALYKLNPVDTGAIYDALYKYPKMHQTDFEAGEIPVGSTVIISHWKFTENEIAEIDALFGSGFITKSTIVTILLGKNCILYTMRLIRQHCSR